MRLSDDPPSFLCVHTECQQPALDATTASPEENCALPTKPRRLGNTGDELLFDGRSSSLDLATILVKLNTRTFRHASPSGNRCTCIVCRCQSLQSHLEQRMPPDRPHRIILDAITESHQLTL